MDFESNRISPLVDLPIRVRGGNLFFYENSLYYSGGTYLI